MRVPIRCGAHTPTLALPTRGRETSGAACQRSGVDSLPLRCAPAGNDTLLVITGLVPVIPIRMARRFSYRDGRDKPGHDVVEPKSVILPILRIGPASAAREGDRVQDEAPSSLPTRGKGGVTP